MCAFVTLNKKITYLFSVLHITFTAFACRQSQIQYVCGAFPPHLKIMI